MCVTRYLHASSLSPRQNSGLRVKHKACNLLTLHVNGSDEQRVGGRNWFSSWFFTVYPRLFTQDFKVLSFGHVTGPLMTFCSTFLYLYPLLDQNREAAFGRAQVIGPVSKGTTLKNSLLADPIRRMRLCMLVPKVQTTGREAAEQMQLWSALLLKDPWGLGLGTWGFLVGIQHTSWSIGTAVWRLCSFPPGL